MSERPDPIPVFDAGAEGYDRVYDQPGLKGEWLRSRMAIASRLLGNGPGTVLDAGMGPGRLCAELDRQGWTVWGVDGSERMVAIARARLPQAAERLLLARVERLPFGNDEFDAVVSTGLLGYVDDPGAAMRELARVLRPGGRAVLAFPNARAPYCFLRDSVVGPAVRRVRRRSPARQLPRRHMVDRRGLETACSAAGLEVEAVEHAGFAIVPDPLDRLFPSASLWAANLAGRPRSPLRGLAATMLVAAARKPPPRLTHGGPP